VRQIPIIGPILSWTKNVVWSILSSLKKTLLALIWALDHRSLQMVYAIFSDGSPLETLVDNVLALAFWILFLVPFVLVPIFFLALSFMR